MFKKLLLLVTILVLASMLFTACQPAAEQPKAEEAAPAAEQPKAEEAAPAAEQPKAKEAAPAAEQPKAEEPIKIGVSIMEMTAYTWFLGAKEGCEKYVKDHPEANFVFQFEDSRSDVQTMLNNIDNLVTWGAKGIILFPADPNSAIPVMKQYVKQGIPFVIGDYAQQPSSDEDIVWSTFVGHDMKALGVKAGEVAVEYLKTLNKEDPVALFVSRPTSGKVSQDRVDGFSETVLAAFPKARIIVEGDIGAGSADSAQSLVENVLQREPVIDVVSGHNDAEVIGAYNAAVAANRTEIKFIGIAGSKEVLTYIDKGNPAWIGEVLQDPVVLGYQATDAMYKVLVLGQKVPLIYELPQPVAITPANIAEFDWKSWTWL
jgi:ABC-type sugar transport system substrate-binding protein